MVQFVGNYEFVSQDNYENYLKAMGLPEEEVQKFAGLKSPLSISEVDDTSITCNYGVKTVKFIFNQETEHVLGKLSVKSLTTLEGDSVTFKTKTIDGKLEDLRVWKFSDSGLVSTSVSNGVTSVRNYKRV